MRSKFTGFTKVLAVCLPFALTFSLSACGDDSSSGANGDDVSGDDAGDGDEDNDRTKAYCSFEGDDWVIDVIEGSDEYIQWRDGKAVVVSKKKMGSASTCKSMIEQGGLNGTCDDQGNLTTTLNVEKYASYSRDELRKMIKEEWYNCVSASGSKSSSSGKSDGKSSSSSNSGPQYENPFKDLKVGECNFKMEDKVWEYVSYSDNFGLGDEYKLHYYQYKDGGSIDSTYTYTFGSNARTLCRLDGDKDTSYTNNYGAKVHFKSWCTSDGMEEFEIQRNTEQDKSREAAFREFMTWCKELNDVSDESSSSTEGDDDSSSSAKPTSSGEANSSSSEKPGSSSVESSSSAKSSSSSKKTEPTFPTNYGKSCEFKKDDNTWYVENKDSKHYEVYEWTGNKAKETSVSFVDLDEPQICETTKGLLPECSAESNNCTCDNELLIMKMTIQKEFSSKAEAYAEIMFNACGIEVEVESSSSEAEEESSSSAAVNNCGFEKTASEWTFITDEVTEIFTWDSNDQYIFTHIARETYEDDEIYEGCEDCKTAQQYCEEDAAGALLEDDEYTYTYTCDEGVMTTTSVSKDKYGDTNERDAIFVDRCLYEE
ncbi:MAG: hypothetical protein II850_05185 [Fibrobacter sp.]|nr:hypothetical protein [Fibrobacter sp.]